jgi:Tfp pilus assembly protein PilE
MKISQKGVSLGEVILIILLISIIAAIAIPRFRGVVQNAKYQACRTNVANINALVQLYYIKEGTWPLVNLSDIKTNVNYFPEQQLPDCPVTTGAAYFIYPTGHRVTGHLDGVTPHP